MVETESGAAVVVREPEHRPKGDPCRICSLPASRHRERDRKRDPRKRSEDRRRHREEARAEREREPIVAIDGEGQDLPCQDCGELDRPRDSKTNKQEPCPVTGKRCDRPHVYTYLAASEEEEKRGSVTAMSRDGLSTKECLEFLLGLGARRVFGFSLGYDLTMILRDLPDEDLYDLVRPKRRERRLPSGRVVHSPIYWQGYKLAYMRRRLEVWRVRWDRDKGHSVPVGASVVVWDVFAFYGQKFTRALKNWKTAPQSVIDQIERMKDQRGEFAKLTGKEIRDYCDDECRLMAKLVRQLIEAHDAANIPLTSFYGAGSTASALLKRMGVKEMRLDTPPEMRDWLARGFFGGRFECSRIGPIRVPCWSHDISSAYPYQLTGLPCLVHGRWRRVSGEMACNRALRSSALGIARCEVRRSGPSSWGPLPFRNQKEKTIVFPRACGNTWVWRDEYLAAKDTLWPGVRAVEAWVYDTACDCRPFAELAMIYRERLAIGKEGAGIVLKLGPNSVYGKLAQSEGTAPFQDWVWAGCITSGTRAQLLLAIAAARDPRSVLMLATDGVLATEKLDLPRPRDTGTWDCVDENGKPVNKPLGGWEVKDAPKGMFVARPGIYWPLDPTDEQLQEVKARGISGKVLHEHSARIQAHFERHGWTEPYKVEGCVRFVGAKQAIRKGEGGEIVRDHTYGRWLDYPIDVGFHPDPKRAEVRRDGSLTCWERMPGSSAAYNRVEARLGPEARRIIEYQEVIEEQPTGDLCMG